MHHVPTPKHQDSETRRFLHVSSLSKNVRHCRLGFYPKFNGKYGKGKVFETDQ
jgi:hypothetical protein